MKYNNYDEMPMFLSIKDVSDTIGLSISRIYDIASTDKTFPCVVLGRRKVVPRDEFKSWIKASSKGFWSQPNAHICLDISEKVWYCWCCKGDDTIWQKEPKEQEH